MRSGFIGLGVVISMSACLCLVAAGQGKVAPVSKKIADMRNQANTDARALATTVQSRAIETGKYDDKLSDYAKYMGGSIPVNPCTGTSTGYTMVITNHGQGAKVAAAAGKRCGAWTPQVFYLTL